MKQKIYVLAIALLFSVNVIGQTPWQTGSNGKIYYNGGNVGVGTDDPIEKLHVTGNITFYNGPQGNGIGTDTDGNLVIYRNAVYNNFQSMLINDDNGNVGIASSNPLEKLHVKGNLFLESVEASTDGWKRTHVYWSGHSLIFGTKPGVYAHNVVDIKPGGASNGSLFSAFRMYQAISENDQELRIELKSSGDSYFNGGNVGIGTTSPSYKLTVNGTIGAKEIKVTTQIGADFVFEHDYDLMSLSELERFVKENKHLPEIAPAKEMEEKGVLQTEMNQKLLQKIEELTLYVIELEKENKAQNDFNQQLLKRVEEIENNKN